MLYVTERPRLKFHSFHEQFKNFCYEKNQGNNIYVPIIVSKMSDSKYIPDAYR